MTLSLEPPPLPNIKTGAQLKRRFTSIRIGLPQSNHHCWRASRFSLYPTFRSRAIVTAVLKTREEGKSAVTEQAEQPVRIVAVVGEGSVSSLKCAMWEEVMLHTVSATFSFFNI